MREAPPLSDTGWTANDERRVHDKLLQDAQKEFDSSLSATHFELRIARNGILLLVVAISIFISCSGFFVPGYGVETRIAMIVTAVLGVAGLLFLIYLARRW